MQVIVVGAAKGGVGKTTLTAAIAVAASRDGKRVALIDRDPLRCLSQWHDTRRESGITTPSLIESNGNLTVEMTAAKRGSNDLVVIDTAPGAIAQLRDAVDAANIFIIPLRPSPLDVQSTDVAIELGRFAGCAMLVVPNATQPNSAMTTGTRSYLATRKVPVWSGEITQDEAHPAAMLGGRTVSEAQPRSRAAENVAALWVTVSKVLAAKKAKRDE